jgi:hypothetical protein
MSRTLERINVDLSKSGTSGPKIQLREDRICDCGAWTCKTTHSFSCTWRVLWDNLENLGLPVKDSTKQNH